MSTWNALSTALYSTLTGGTALTALLSGTAAVYNTQAPDGAATPYVVFSLQGGGPLNITPSDVREEVVFIRAYSKTSMANASNIDAQINSLIHKQTLTVSGYTNYFTVREQDFAISEPQENGIKMYMAGANYRLSLDS
jgi:hypothetical protein